MSKVIVIYGPMCSGKTTYAHYLESKGIKRIRTVTTRPMRKKEERDAYIFVTDEDYEEMKNFGQFTETAVYSTPKGLWKYGSRLSDYNLDEDCCIVLSPDGVQVILEHKKAGLIHNDIYTVAMDAPVDLRIKRATKRGDDPKEIARRIQAEKGVYSQLLRLLPVPNETRVTITKETNE